MQCLQTEVSSKLDSQQFPYFESCIKGDPNIQFASIGLPDRVIISRQLGVVPAYTIDGLFDYEAAYAEEKCKCYIDEDLNLRMEQTGFTMKPQRAADNREADQLELWILACIFNLIRNEKGQYQIKCSKGKMLDDGWYTLGTYRNMAFDEFKRIYKDIKVDFTVFPFEIFQKFYYPLADDILICKVVVNCIDTFCVAENHKVTAKF